MIYPATYNVEDRTATKNLNTLTSANQYVSIELLNVTNTTTYNFFEIMSNSTSVQRMYYCNSSYIFNSDATVSVNCASMGTLPANNPYNHTHAPNSQHQVVVMAFNITTGTFNNVKVSPNSYFLLRGNVGAGNAVNYYSISNLSRTGAMRTTNNGGITWTNQTYTVDAHLHQFSGNSSIYYYINASDTSNYITTSATRQDLLELGGLPPSAGDVYSPIATSYNNLVSINYTPWISPNSYPISFYNISLFNSGYTFNKTLVSNNSLNLGYVWNTTTTSEGNYTIEVKGCDNISQCSVSYSEIFILDRTSPNIRFESDTTPIGNFSQNWILSNVSVYDLNTISNVDVNLYRETNLTTPTNLVATQTDSGIFSDDCQTFTFTVYAYRNSNFNPVFSLGNSTTISDTCTSTVTYDINLTWNAVPLADYYRVVISDDFNGYADDAYIDVATNNLIYDGTVTESQTSPIVTPTNELALITDLTTGNFSRNYTNLPDGIYYINASAYDSAGNLNSTETRKIVLDVNSPFVSVTAPSNNSYLNNALVNFIATITDSIGIKNYTLYIFNPLGLFSQDSFTGSDALSIISNIAKILTDGVYTWFYETFDFTGNKNTTGNSTVTIDTTAPLISFNNNTTPSGLTQDYNIFVNLSVYDVNLQNFTTYLYNNTSLINTSNTLISNFSNLSDGTYYFNATAYDLLGNYNYTLTRNVTISTTAANITLVYPDGLNVNTKDLVLLATTDKLATCYYNYDNTSNVLFPTFNNLSFYTEIQTTNGNHNINVTCYNIVNLSSSIFRTFFVNIADVSGGSGSGSGSTTNQTIKDLGISTVSNFTKIKLSVNDNWTLGTKNSLFVETFGLNNSYIKVDILNATVLGKINYTELSIINLANGKYELQYYIPKQNISNLTINVFASKTNKTLNSTINIKLESPSNIEKNIIMTGYAIGDAFRFAKANWVYFALFFMFLIVLLLFLILKRSRKKDKSDYR
jgi:hypothetical protein